jgi:flagellar biosynthesis/type III secretory pathway M-ring protein FliF/YscJ
VIAASVPLLVLAEDEEFDPNTVTPGVWGFVLTFVVMLVVLLLVLDMVRRIRRVNYRAEVREQLEQERLDEELQHLTEADGQSTDAAGDTDAASDTDVPGDAGAAPTDAAGDAPDDERPRGASDR